MATINTDGRPAYMYDADTSTWYAISGRVSTNANYVWSGAHQFTNNVTMDGALTATLKFNSFLNPAARTAAIPSPGVGLLTFLQQDAGGSTINRFEYWNGSAWVVIADLSSTQTLTNKTLTSPTISSPTLSGTITNSGTITDGSATRLNLTSPLETWNVAATAATGTVNIDTDTSTVWYYTTNASANWTLNFRASSGTTLSSRLAVGQSISVTFMATNGVTPYYANAFQIDGSSVTPKWQFGSAPAAGNASSIDVYTFTIVKTAVTPTYTVFASMVKHA